jgi:hypothetical protein
MLRRIALLVAGMTAGLFAAAAIARALIPSRGDESSDELALVAIIGGRTLRSHATAFRGGTASAWMAGVDLDLRDVRIDPAGARLEVTGLASGVAIRLPPDARASVAIRSRASGISVDLVGIDELPRGAPRLELTGLAVGCGVSITNRSDDEIPERTDA